MKLFTVNFEKMLAQTVIIRIVYGLNLSFAIYNRKVILHFTVVMVVFIEITVNER